MKTKTIRTIMAFIFIIFSLINLYFFHMPHLAILFAEFGMALSVFNIISGDV